MRILSLWQPWATLFALRIKEYETRGWDTKYRGEVAIHAAKKMDRVTREAFCKFAHLLGPAGFVMDLNLPRGCIIGVGNLVNVVPITGGATGGLLMDGTVTSEQEFSMGLYAPGRFALKFEGMRRLKVPIPFKGQQGFPTLTDSNVFDLLKENA